MTNRLQTLLDEKSILLADGAMATNLFPLGLKPGDAAEVWNLSAPWKIADLHQQFVEAGADILLTNSFGANACRLERHNKATDVRPLNIAAARLAASVAKAAQREIIIAGNMGPLGCEITSTGAMQPDEATRLFRQQAEALAEGGVDLLWLETISDRVELEAALAAARSTGLPVIATLSFHGGGTGREPLIPSDLPSICHAATASPTAWGSNCGNGPGEALLHLLEFGKQAKREDILTIKANCGLPEVKDAMFTYPATPDIMGDYARLAADAGARIIGVCCGATPAHVKAMADALRDYCPKRSPTRREIEARFAPLMPH